MANGHALSVFTHSCLSTPRDPRTKLPSSRLDDQLNRSAPHISYHERPHTTNGDFRHSRTRQDVQKTFGNNSFEASLQSVHGHHATIHSLPLSSDTHNASQNILSRSTGSVPMVNYLNPKSLSGNVRPSTSDGSHQRSTEYSTLFTTLLESNSLLREEIKKLREEQQRTLHTVEQLNRRDCAVQTSGNTSVHSSLSNDRKNRSVETKGVTQSLPQRLLENTWIELPSEHSEDPLHTSSSSSLSHQEHSVHSLNEEVFNTHEHDDELHVDSLSMSSLDSVSVEEVDAEQIHMDPDVPSPKHPDKNNLLSSSSESLLSSCTSTTSESGSRPSQAVEDDPFASPGMVAVEKMWDDFSVDEYAPYTPRDHDEEEMNHSGTKIWTPRITIPEPFSMTVRDANSQKTKSRSMLLAEEERLRKEALEEAELRKKFRSSPVPATTYLPLYELINAKNEQRREQIKHASKAILKSTEKPFSFMKREDKKRKNKVEALRLSQEFERAQQKKESMFIAKPVPKHVFDSSVDDKIQEQEEYRRIRIQMRSEELMSKSKLPGSMQVRGSREYTVGALRKKRLEENQAKAFLTDEHKFHPAISNNVPDYDQAYLEFQNELARRKEAQQTTIAKPFYLRTQMIPSRREQVMKDMETDEVALPENRWPFVGKRTKAPHLSSKPSSSSVPYPAQMTKTAKVRESLTKEKLASESKKELLEEDERRKKREREKLVRQSVAQKSLSLDPTAWLEERKRQKLQEVRRLDKERQRKYEQELKEIEDRVQSRPLLLEQTSLKSAVRSAELKYTTALKKAGLSENDIQALTTS